MDRTINYYEKNAHNYVEGTKDVAFTDVQDRFLSFLPESSFILDFGCGSGRDTKYFIGKGHIVDAIEGSEKLCEIASSNTGVKVRHMLFSELDSNSVYDGIWACASILHLKKFELRNVFVKMIKAVKPGGYIYASFKYGEFEGYRLDRYFTDFTKESFCEFIKDVSGFILVEIWISEDVRPGRGEEKWLNLILQRRDTA